MCRNIRPLFNFDPGANDKEIYEASLQYVRKISGFQKPSKANEEAFNHAIAHIAEASRELIDSLETEAAPKNREEEKRKAHEKAIKRFGSN